MGTVKFYHLSRHPLHEAARMLLEGALKQGWPVMLRGTDPAQLDRLDSQLWLHPDDGFLPHGREGGGHDSLQPVLLGLGAATNGARALMLLAGSGVDPDEAAAMERVWLLFEGNDDAQLEAARREWRAVTAAGLVAEYWADASGRWEKKAESGGAPA